MEEGNSVAEDLFVVYKVLTLKRDQKDAEGAEGRVQLLFNVVC